MMEQQTFYFLLISFVVLSTILPFLASFINRKRQQKAFEEQLEKRQRYLASLEVGDEVVLFSGLHGTIGKERARVVELQIAKGVLVYVEKESIMGKAEELGAETLLS